MNVLIKSTLAVLAGLIIAQPGLADEKEKFPKGMKCFIMKKRTIKNTKYAIDYKDAKLYLCCKSCVKRMTKTPDKYEAKANHQLVQTGQFEQKTCPISGDAVTANSPKLEIGGVNVRFSSDSHKAEVAKLEDGKQIDKVFGKDGFKKGGFVLIEKKDS